MKLRNALILSCALLAACTVGDDYKRPQAPAPQAWTNGTTTQAWPDAEWWKQFHSDELNTLVQQALANNYDIKAAMARVRQADAQLQISGATLFPSVDLDANTQRAQTGSTTRNNNQNSNSRFVSNSNSVGATASYELDFWGKNRSTIAANQAALHFSQYDQQAVQMTVVTSVANTYFDLLATKTRLAAAEGNLAAAERLLQSLKNKYTNGVASSLDVAQQENVVATERATLPSLALQVQQDQNALAVLVGTLPQGFDANTSKTNLSNISAPEIQPGLPSGLLERRPDVAEAEANLVEMHENINAARAALFPDITLTVDGGYGSSVLSNMFKPGGEFFTLGAGLTQPLFHAGALSGAVELEKARYDELLQVYQKTVIAAFSDTENNLAASARNAELLAAQQTAAQTAEHAYQLSQQQFQAGIVDISSVLNTQRTMYTAQDNLAQAQLAKLESAVNLYAALGGGWHR